MCEPGFGRCDDGKLWLRCRGGVQLTSVQPDGKPGPNKDKNTGFLQYNEYILYNVEHSKMRYLLGVAM